LNGETQSLVYLRLEVGMKIVTDFMALSLEQQTEAHPQITAAFNAAKDARRLQLEAEVGVLVARFIQIAG
jgi:hypothetical protein